MYWRVAHHMLSQISEFWNFPYSLNWSEDVLVFLFDFRQKASDWSKISWKFRICFLGFGNSWVYLVSTSSSISKSTTSVVGVAVVVFADWADGVVTTTFFSVFAFCTPWEIHGIKLLFHYFTNSWFFFLSQVFLVCQLFFWRFLVNYLTILIKICCCFMSFQNRYWTISYMGILRQFWSDSKDRILKKK